MKKLLVILAIGTFAACDNGTSTENTTDSTISAVDSVADAKTDMIDSTAEAKKDMIDSTADATKDSLKEQH